MTSNHHLYKVLFVLVILFGVTAGWFMIQKQKTPDSASEKPFQTQNVLFYEEPLFLPAVREVEKINEPPSESIKGGVIPHHLLPVTLLARFFHKLSIQQPKRILLIGPNHPEKGEKLITTDWGWNTAFGKIPPDEEMIALFKQVGVSIDHDIIEHEHSVSGMTPFIKYFIPQAKVATLILSNTLTLPELNQIADDIISVVNDDTVIIAPIDFSHYLTSKEAKQKDEVTWDVIEKYSYSSILSMNNDYVDGRTSLVLELLLMKKLGYSKIKLYEHTNSGELMNDPYSPTTSYFSFGFYKDTN